MHTAYKLLYVCCHMHTVCIQMQANIYTFMHSAVYIHFTNIRMHMDVHTYVYEHITPPVCMLMITYIFYTHDNCLHTDCIHIFAYFF